MWKHVLGSVLLWFGVTVMTVGLAGAGDRDPRVNVALGAAALPVAAALMLLFRRQIAQGRLIPPLNSLRKGVWFERIFAVLCATPVFVLTQANVKREDYYVVGGMLVGSALVFWASSATLRKPVLVRLLLDRDPAVRAQALATLDRAGWRPRDDRAFLEAQSRALEEESRKREQAAGAVAQRRADAEREERERVARQAQKDAEERKKTHGMDKEKVAAELGALSAVIYSLKRGTTLPTDQIVDLILEFQAMDERELMELKDEDLALKKFLVKRGFVQDW